MKAYSVGREAAGSPEVEAGRHRIGIRSVLGQSGLRIRLGGKGPVAIDPIETSNLINAEAG